MVPLTACRLHLFNWGFQICLQKLCSSSVHPMSSSWLDIGCTEGKSNLWRQIRHPQLEGRGLLTSQSAQKRSQSATELFLWPSDDPFALLIFGGVTSWVSSVMFALIMIRRPNYQTYMYSTCTGCPISSWTGLGWFEFWWFHCLPYSAWADDILSEAALSWARWWNTQTKVNSTQVHEQIGHPVDMLQL